MIISNPPYTEAFVWIWLPGETEPVVAGKLSQEGQNLLFNYGKSYLERGSAIPLYDQELPLQPGVLPLLAGRRGNPACNKYMKFHHTLDEFAQQSRRILASQENL